MNQREARDAIRFRNPFKASALTGSEVHQGVSGDLGRLPEEYRKAFREAVRRRVESGLSMYAVWSYDTPIGWTQGGETVIPDVRYSVTTSKHQGIVRRYLPAEG